MTPSPIPAVQTFYCQECGAKVEKGEPTYNLANTRICLICWSAPPAGGSK